VDTGKSNVKLISAAVDDSSARIGSSPSQLLVEYPRLGTRTGFTLIEMSVVLVIVAVIVATGISMGQSMVESAKLVNSKNKLDQIEAALMAYRMAYNRLPCPTDPTMTEISDPVHFGYEAANQGSCTGGTPATSVSYTNSSNNTTVEGAVPVKTLGLSNDFMFDGWGRKFGYAVWTNITATQAFINYGVTTNCGSIKVQNAGGGNRSTAADYALISYGPDGHGGYTVGGTRYNAGSTNTAEQTNAHYNASGVDTGYLATYIQQDWTSSSTDSKNVFDDLVRFKERFQLMTVDDQWMASSGSMPCTPGFVINGPGATGGTRSGALVAVGDVNGDGIPDMVIEEAYGTANIYVVFGTKSGFPDPLPLSSLNGTNGTILTPTYAAAGAPNSMVVGDINGDGVADIILGTGTAEPWPDTGMVYVVFGHTGTWSSSYALNSSFMNGTNGVALIGAATGYNAGSSVAIGDVNGDGVNDLIIGASGTSPGGNASAGSVYVVFGQKCGGTTSGYSACTSPEILNSTFLNGTNGVEFDGAAANYQIGGPYTSPQAVAAGDVNGDGIADIIIGAGYAGSSGYLTGGSVYVVFGHKSGWSGTATTLNSTFLNGTNGVEFDGKTSPGWQRFGSAVIVGDINGDGIGDIIVGVGGGPSTGPCGNGQCGEVDVIFGKTSGWSATATTVTSAFLNGTNGFELDGTVGVQHVSGYQGTGIAVGDVNGDGITDLILGGPGGSGANDAYVVFGQKTGWSSSATNLNSTYLNGTNGVTFAGPNSGDGTGASVAVGDVNGDGIADIVIGAPLESPNGNTNVGSTYVYYGKKKHWPTSAYNLGGL